MKKLDALRAEVGATDKEVIAVLGDLSRKNLGVADADVKKLKGKIDHMFHLAAIYDLKASAEEQQEANVEGTRHAVQFAQAASVGCFHHVSSIAAAGLYDGVFREDMFEEAEDLDPPLLQDQARFRSDRAPRMQAALPHLSSGLRGRRFEDRLHRQDRRPVLFLQVPPEDCGITCRNGCRCWASKAARVNIVPVDFVADALDFIAHKKGLDGKCFHLTDPDAHRIGEVLNIFAKAGPRAADDDAAQRADVRLHFLRPLLYGIGSLAPIKRMVRAVLTDLGIPKDVFQFINWPTRYDNREAAKALKGSGITVPPLASYAPKILGLLGTQPRPGPLHRTAAWAHGSRTRSSS